MRLSLKILQKLGSDAFSILNNAEHEANQIAENAIPDNRHTRADWRALAKRRIKRIESLRQALTGAESIARGRQCLPSCDRE